MAFFQHPGGVAILNADGIYLGKIICNERPANMAWGDADGKTLYMIAHSIYKIRTNTGKPIHIKSIH